MIRYFLVFFIVISSLFGMSDADKAFFASISAGNKQKAADDKKKANRNKKLNAKNVIEATKRSSSAVLKSDVDKQKREKKLQEILDTAAYMEKRLEAKKKLLGARNRIKLLKSLLKSEDFNRYRINISQIQNIFSLGTNQKIVLTGAKLNNILKYLVDDFSAKQAQKKGTANSSDDKEKKVSKKDESSNSTNLSYNGEEQIVLANGDLITYNPDFIINFVRVEKSYAIFKIASK